MVLIVVMFAYLVSPVFYSFPGESKQEYSISAYSLTVTPSEIANKIHFSFSVDTFYILLLLSLLGSGFLTFRRHQSAADTGGSCAYLLPCINAP
jgi:hypothetical protein